MLPIFFLNHVHLKRNLISELLARLPSRSCSGPLVPTIPVLQSPIMAKLTLQELVSLQSEKDKIDYSKKTLEDMHELPLQAGTKHKGKQFQEIYKDQGYNQWVAARVTEDPCSPQGVELYAYYLRKRLEAEIPAAVQQEFQEKKEEKKETRKEKGRHPPVSKPTKESIAALESSLTEPLAEMEESESQWTQVSHLEENMAHMGDRLQTLEHMLGQMMGYLQQQEQARVSAQAAAAPQGQ